MDRIKAWWTIAKWIWITLLMGYAWVGISVAIGFQIPASGAVLICAGVISELLFERLNWRGYVRIFGHGLVKRHSHTDNPTYAKSDNSIGLGGGTEILDTLRLLSKPKDNSPDREVWSITMTSDRVDFVIALAIGIAVIIGTVIWGYGEYIIDLSTRF